MNLAGQMTKPIQLLGWKQMKQVVANTSRLNFEISLRLLVCLCLTSRFNRKTTPHPPAKTQNHQNLNAGSRDQNATDRQTQKPTNEHRHLVFALVNYFFLSLFLFLFFFFSFFLLSFFIFYFYFLLHYFLSFRFLSFLLSFFLSF